MKKSTVNELEDREAIVDPLTELLREGPENLATIETRAMRFLATRKPSQSTPSRRPRTSDLA